ncbi:hypothetical protein KAFR_0B03670 [Kazachstania africana CBS 2517]|uniref:G-patch domain-containing protein n=1 Tax=Kazachstania africana (strain ATCC 22294 / BCRC 22015 / CBS 2517 / CECT 1963 / NBRC 1671 / NRRL Y-8276) TaxID=1071382 RepID=H2AQL4_KAZAF|nr:hypothetical protein KAFR_0B03670 [Kazachstania africana CBS 2517]CCF56664.1 hypothetical protein KAFR_0B03670 [Kazachstania africana CBS 2517]
MDSRGYLKSYGWEEGEGLRKGSLKKPILVKHKRDRKGLGNAVGHDDGEVWWERLFDGHLKNLDISSSSKGDGIVFKQKKVVASAMSKGSSPLYQWFVKGEGLKGTIDNKTSFEAEDLLVSSISITKKRKREDKIDSKKSKHKKRKHSTDKKKDKKKDGRHKPKSKHSKEVKKSNKEKRDRRHKKLSKKEHSSKKHVNTLKE